MGQGQAGAWGGLCRGLLSSRLVSLLNSDDGGKQFKNNLEEIEMKVQIKDTDSLNPNTLIKYPVQRVKYAPTL